MRTLKNRSVNHQPADFASPAARTLTVVLMAWTWFSSSDAALAQDANEDFRASTDVFLRNLTAAEHHGMGNSFVGSIAGANALNTNPAGLSFLDNNRFVTHAARFPRTIVVVSKLNKDERYEEHAQYDLRAAGLEFINYSIPLGAAGVIGFDLALGHVGQFSRVNELGQATNTFPENELAIGIGYAVKLLEGLSVGADAKWLRSKVQDAENRKHIGHGYAYNIGVIQQIGDNLRIGGALRNLSNGLSFSDDSIPDKVHRDALIGGMYQFSYKDAAIQVGFDLNPPFEDGLRTNLGGEVWYRGMIGGRIGYLRHTEERLDSVLLLETGETEFAERLWKAEGLTLGLGVRLGKLNINAAVTPQIRPVANEGEKIRIEQGRAVYAFSVGRRF